MTRTKSPKGQERRRAQRVRAAIPLSIEARDSGAEALLKDIWRLWTGEIDSINLASNATT